MNTTSKQACEDSQESKLYGQELVRQLGFWQTVKEDYATHNQRDWTKPGFRALLVYRFGTWRLGSNSKLLRGLTWFIYINLYRFVRNVYGIEVFYTAKIGRRLFIAHQGGIIIHKDATIGDDCHIRQGVTIGNAGNEDGLELEGPIIGDRVTFGAGSVSIGNLKIGNDVTIGPNCVLVKDIPDNTTAFIPPARILPKNIESPIGDP
jgi:serine O-acetyltransferase